MPEYIQIYGTFSSFSPENIYVEFLTPIGTVGPCFKVPYLDVHPFSHTFGVACNRILLSSSSSIFL